MDGIFSKSRTLGLLIFILPILTINFILFFSQSFEFRYEPVPGNYLNDIKIYNAGDALRDKQDVWVKGYAIPYIDGATSISRLGRVFPNNLLFKPIMILTGFFLILFWKYQRNIFINLKAKIKKINKVYYFGVAAGISLIIHTFFLGIKFDNDFYKFFIRLNLALHVIFGLLAKFYFVNTIKDLGKVNSYFKNFFFNVQYYLIYFLLIILFLCIPLLIIEKSKSFILIIEWNFFLGILLFYLLYFFSYRKYHSVIQPPPSTL